MLRSAGHSEQLRDAPRAAGTPRRRFGEQQRDDGRRPSKLFRKCEQLLPKLIGSSPIGAQDQPPPNRHSAEQRFGKRPASRSLFARCAVAREHRHADALPAALESPKSLLRPAKQILVSVAEGYHVRRIADLTGPIAARLHHYHRRSRHLGLDNRLVCHPCGRFAPGSPLTTAVRKTQTIRLKAPARDHGLRGVCLAVRPPAMLDDFLRSHRDAIIARTRARVALRTSPEPTDVELTNGIPVFLDQLGDALRVAKSSDVIDHEQIGKSAGRHGLDLFRMGLTVGQVVHDYGDVCQVVTELAVEEKASISGEEFRTLNLCLDDAIAGAVAEYSHQREVAIVEQGTERLGVLAHELRNALSAAMLAFEEIKSGRVAVGGSTGGLVSRSLLNLHRLIDRSLADVRLDAGIDRVEHISVADLVSEVEVGAAILARARDINLTVTSVARVVSIEGDRQILAATISNLLQNAFKFTGQHGNVCLTTRAITDRVLFEVEDECGGLPPGRVEEMFLPFEQQGADRSGVGLGLSICLKAAKAHGGEIRVRNIPGTGCVFTLDLPRKSPPPLSVVDGKKGTHDSPKAKSVAGDIGTTKTRASQAPLERVPERRSGRARK